MSQHIDGGVGIAVAVVAGEQEDPWHVSLGLLGIHRGVQQVFIVGESLREIKLIGGDKDGKPGACGFVADELQDLLKK